MFKWIKKLEESNKIKEMIPLILVLAGLLFISVAAGRTFFVGREMPLVADPNVPFLKPATIQLSLVDTTTGIFTIDPWLNSTHIYGDLNRDGICDAVDKNLWDNVWGFSERITHAQWIWQSEKKQVTYIPRIHTYLEFSRGRRLIGKTPPPVVYYTVAGPTIPSPRSVTIQILLLDPTDETFNIDPWLNSTHPYGDLNKDGVCDSIDKNLWDNVWSTIEKNNHRQSVSQSETEYETYVPRVHTYIEAARGVQYLEKTYPPVIYHIGD